MRPRTEAHLLTRIGWLRFAVEPYLRSNLPETRQVHDR